LNFKFLYSLQSKLALGVILVSLVPLVIVGFFAARTAEQLIEGIVSNHLDNVVSDKQQLLQRWVAERRADLEVVAGSSIVQSMDPALITPYLKVVQDRYQVYRRFVIAGVDGRAVHDGAQQSGRDYSLEAWRTAGVARQRYASAVRLGDDSNESVFDLAAPIDGPDGRLRGVVCVTVSTTNILRHVLHVSLGQTGECYLVDKTGTFLAHQDPLRILKDNIAESESFTNLARDKSAAARRRPLYTDYRGIVVLGASRPIPDTDWHVVVEQDRDEAFAPLYMLRRYIGAVLALTVIGVVALSLSLAYNISRPIRVLSEASHALARGDFDYPPIRWETGRHDEIGMLATAFENMGHQLQERHRTLETRMGQTEVELQQTDARLQDAIRMAARAEHLAALGRLASGVAHEIRTPLASLKLYLQSVQEDITISAELAEDFEIAARQVNRMEATINHFLDFARPQEPVFAGIDFSRLITDALLVVQPRAIHQEVEIETDLASAVPEALGDARQLGEAVVNLMVNALDEMPTGGRLHISVSAETTDLDGCPARWTRIDVTDSGPGIREADRERLFEPFFTTKASGSGLGLSIVRSTVEKHGGLVRVHAAPGGGTTFSVLLPAAASSSDTQHE